MKPTAKWLKLQLRDDQRMESRYIIIHTHFSIYSHLREQGYQLSVYEASNYTRDLPNPVIYIKTDHEGFYKSCCQYYAHDFDLSDPGEFFQLPSHFRSLFGTELPIPALAS